MTRNLLCVTDGGSHGKKLSKALRIFAEARDFKVLTAYEPKNEVAATIVIAETAEMPANFADGTAPRAPVALCVFSDACTYQEELDKALQGHSKLALTSTQVSIDAPSQMYWMHCLWEALDKAGMPSRVPSTLLVVPVSSESSDVVTDVHMSGMPFYDAEVVEHRLLTHPDYPRPSYMLTLDYKDAPITYTVGDHIAILPENRNDKVQRLLTTLNLDGSKIYRVTDPASGVEITASLHELLKSQVDIQGLARRKFLATMALLADSASEAAELAEMATDMSADSPYSNSIKGNFSHVDVLERFPSLRLSAEQVLTTLPGLRPRYYSVSGSPLRHPTQVQLTFTLLSFPMADGVTFSGTNTGYMADLKAGSRIRMNIKEGARDPTLETPGMKYVGVALGSGVSALRGIAEHFQLLQQEPQSSLLLYYGVRHKAQDFMFGDEFEAMQKTGAVDLRVAFSHDQKEFITPAHRIQEDPEALCKYLVDDKQSKFFYCGPSGPALSSILKAVEAAVKTARPQCDFEDLIARMKQEHRWHAEAYMPMPDPENPFQM